MRPLRIIAAATLWLATVTGTSAQGPVLIQSLTSRECSIQVGSLQSPEIQSVTSREVSAFLGAEPDPPWKSASSREHSLLVADDLSPPPVDAITVTVSPDGSSVTLNWSTYPTWAVRDVVSFAIYAPTTPITSVTGLTPATTTPATQQEIILNHLTAWQDHYFAIVAIDAFGNYNPAVTYAAAYVLSPQTCSREVTLFTGSEPTPPFACAASREVSVVIADDAPPPAVTDFIVTVSPTGSSVALDWPDYDPFAVRDILRFDVYMSSAPITDVTGLTPTGSSPGDAFHWEISGLPEWQDRFFAIVPVDALGNQNPLVTYSSAYVLSPQTCSREWSLFTGGDAPQPIAQASSREVSVVIADDTVPAPVTGIGSGFTASTSTSDFGAIHLDWTSYPEWSQRDVRRYLIYIDSTFFADISGMTPRATVTGAQQWTLTGLPGNAIVYVAVTAEDWSGNQSPTVYSISAKASPGELGEVAHLTASSQMTSTTYTWQLADEENLAGFIDHFRVYFANSPSPRILPPGARSWTATGLSPGHTYLARFTTADIRGFESSGIEIPATTLASPAPTAYWRFEEGTLNTPVPDTQSGTLPIDPVLDSSGKGNPLRTWNASTAPIYQANTASPTVPHTHQPNQLSLAFTPDQSLYTANPPLASQPLTSFTLEASALPLTLNTRQTLTGRDGTSHPPPIALNLLESNYFSISIIDGSDTLRTVESLAPATAGQWHHLAATCSQTHLSLYLQGPTDPEPVLQGTIEITHGLKDAPGTWSVGRGWQGGAPALPFSGRIDEVRLTPEAIPANHFLYAPSPWQQWLKQNFTPQELLDPAISAPLADPDRDGLPNLAEYVTGSPPLLRNPRPMPILTGPSSHPALEYAVNLAASDTAIVFETSPSLLTNSWQPVTPIADWMTSWSESTQIRKATLPQPTTLPAFYRARIQHPIPIPPPTP